MFEFDTGICGCEVPIGLAVSGIAIIDPGGNFLDEDRFVANPAIEALG